MNGKFVFTFCLSPKVPLYFSLYIAKVGTLNGVILPAHSPAQPAQSIH